MDLPRGATDKLNGMAVNTSCQQHSSALTGHCGPSEGTVDSVGAEFFEACEDGGRYKVTKITNCNRLHDEAYDFGDGWAIPNAVCSFMDTYCESAGCKKAVEVECDPWTGDCENILFPDDSDQNSEIFDSSCGSVPGIIEGCCRDMNENQWYEYTWEENTGCHACAECDTLGVDCTSCDGCNDEEGCEELCESCRLPSDCPGGCWVKETNSLMGQLCKDYSHPLVNPPNDTETQCSAGCTECGSPGSAADPSCPCNWICDCIEKGMEEGDKCCLFGDSPDSDGKCPSNSQWPICMGSYPNGGYELGTPPFADYNPKSCDCLRCHGSDSGSIPPASLGVCCVNTSAICDDNNTGGYTLEQCDALGGTFVQEFEGEPVIQCGSNNSMCVGACCSDWIGCEIMDVWNCTANFEGTFQGLGTSCDDVDCSSGGGPQPLTTTTSPGDGLELISTPAGCVWMMNASPELPRCP